MNGSMAKLAELSFKILVQKNSQLKLAVLLSASQYEDVIIPNWEPIEASNSLSLALFNCADLLDSMKQYERLIPEVDKCAFIK